MGRFLQDGNLPFFMSKLDTPASASSFTLADPRVATNSSRLEAVAGTVTLVRVTWLKIRLEGLSLSGASSSSSSQVRETPGTSSDITLSTKNVDAVWILQTLSDIVYFEFFDIWLPFIRCPRCLNPSDAATAPYADFRDICGMAWSLGPDCYSNGRRSKQSQRGDWSVPIHLRKLTANRVQWQKLDQLLTWHHHSTFRFLRISF